MFLFAHVIQVTETAGHHKLRVLRCGIHVVLVEYIMKEIQLINAQLSL